MTLPPERVAELRQLYARWRGGHVLHPEHPAHRDIARLLEELLNPLCDAADENARLRAERDELLVACAPHVDFILAGKGSIYSATNPAVLLAERVRAVVARIRGANG